MIKLHRLVDFLLGSSVSFLAFNSNSDQVKRNEILQNWKLRQKIVEHFWKKLKTEYLQQLRNNHPNTVANCTGIQKDDVNLHEVASMLRKLSDKSIHRSIW